MTIRLTETNFNELCDDIQLNHYQGKVKFSTWFGQGSSYWTMLRHNLELVIQQSDFSETVIVEGEHDDSSFLTSKFLLSGGMRTTTPNVPGVSDDYEEVAGYNYLFYLPDIREFEHFTANQHKQCISIYWYPDLLSSFQGCFNELPTMLVQLIENPTKERFHQPLGAITPAMRLVLRQILQCPFRETLRQMYLEAKVLELLTLQIAQWGENNLLLERSLYFRPDEIERLHHAKAILNQRLQHPPSLLNLAMLIGLNDFKLKRGFREIFGTTVCRYVQSLRLEQAQQLLLGTNLTIAEIASQVGYESTSHFGYLFKRQFGMTPREYRQRKG